MQSGLSYAQAINSAGPRASTAAREPPPAAIAGQAGGSGAAAGAAAEEEAGHRGDPEGARAGAPAEPKLLFTLGGVALAPSATIFQAVQVGDLFWHVTCI